MASGEFALATFWWLVELIWPARTFEVDVLISFTIALFLGASQTSQLENFGSLMCFLTGITSLFSKWGKCWRVAGLLYTFISHSQ